MFVELKRKEVLDLYFAMDSVNKNEDNNKWFTYGIIVNEDKIKPIVTGIIEVSKPNSEYNEYEQQREVLIQKYSEKDEYGNRVMIENLIKIEEEHIESCKESLSNLEIDYKNVIDKRNKDLHDYNQILEEEIEIDIDKIKFEYFPENINIKILKALKPLIED